MKKINLVTVIVRSGIWEQSRYFRVVVSLLMFLVVAFLFGSCSSKGAITIGLVKSADSLITGEIYAQALEKLGYKVTRYFDIADPSDLYKAVVQGDIDIAVGYVGAALTKVLGQGPAGDQYATYTRLAAQYKNSGIVLLEPLPASNSWALAALRETLKSRNIKTYTDLQEKAAELTLAVTVEFKNDPEAYALLEAVYGRFYFKEIKILDETEQQDLLRHNMIDLISIRANDGHLADPEIKTLRDNFHAFVPQTIAPAAKQEFIEGHTDIRTGLNKISASLNDTVIISLNNKTAIQLIPYVNAARDYLKENTFFK